MENLYKVTFNVDDKYGYIALDEKQKEVSVVYPDADVAKKILAWLNTEHSISVPDDSKPIYEFVEKKFLASRSKKEFEVVLTRIWEELEVHIDWSFPPEYI